MNDDFNSKLKKIHDNVYQWASSELNRELVGRDGGDKYTGYSYEEFERDLISLIKSDVIGETTLEANGGHYTYSHPLNAESSARDNHIMEQRAILDGGKKK